MQHRIDQELDHWHQHFLQFLNIFEDKFGFWHLFVFDDELNGVRSICISLKQVAGFILIIHVLRTEVPVHLLLSHRREVVEGSEALLALIDQICRYRNHALVSVLAVAPGVDENMLHPLDSGGWMAPSEQCLEQFFVLLRGEVLGRCAFSDKIVDVLQHLSVRHGDDQGPEIVVVSAPLELSLLVSVIGLICEGVLSLTAGQGAGAEGVQQFIAQDVFRRSHFELLRLSCYVHSVGARLNFGFVCAILICLINRDLYDWPSLSLWLLNRHRCAKKSSLVLLAEVRGALPRSWIWKVAGPI